MSGRIPEDKIDEIRTAADIEEVVAQYVPLKRRGRNLFGKCPFHDEKTPSFSVSPDRQIFHCFGCGKGGNVFTFLMEYEKISFVDAVRSLADRYGISLPRYESKKDDRYERLLYIHEVATQFFEATRKKPGYREKIEPYLYQIRGLTPEVIEIFRLGLAPDEWQGLIEHAESKDISVQELETAGLAGKSRQDRYYDKFRLRLMIPIFNLTGKVVAFGGRALRKGEPAKYMNSPETPLYNKSAILYGLHASKQSIRETGAAILVEGYFDLLALYQAGIKNVAALSGTAFTPQQARLLSRFAEKVYLFFDADSAGRSAALRSIENFFNVGMEPIIVTPPTPHDPDSFVREFGPQEVVKLMDKGEDYFAFRFSGIDPSALSIREQEQVVREVRSLASKIGDSLRRELFVAKAAETIGLPPKTFIVPEGKPAEEPGPLDRTRDINIIESEFLSLLLAAPQMIESVKTDIAPEDLKGPGHREIYTTMLDMFKETGNVKADKLIEREDKETTRSALSLIATIDWGDLDIGSIVAEYKRMILNQKRDLRLHDLKQQLAEAEKNGETEKARELGQEIKYLLEKRA